MQLTKPENKLARGVGLAALGLFVVLVGVLAWKADPRQGAVERLVEAVELGEKAAIADAADAVRREGEETVNEANRRLLAILQESAEAANPNSTRSPGRSRLDGALYALERIGADAVPALVEAWRVPGLRASLRAAVREIGGPAVPRLAQYLEGSNDPRIRHAAADLLHVLASSEIEGTAAAAALAEALAEEDPDIREKPGFSKKAGLSDDHPLTSDQRKTLEARLRADAERLTKLIEANPDNVSFYSLRGDAYFRLGLFEKAVADYEKMVQIDPRLDAKHWRLGLAQFYAGTYEKAARQFEKYQLIDDVDRENGIWRFFSQAKAHGVEKARRNLLKYTKADREPLGDVYKLISKEIKPQRILQRIEQAQISDRERDKRLFYAHLYIGLNAAIAGNDAKLAQKHLREAVASTWGASRKSGYGPHYMWHVGRLHYESLLQDPADAKADK